MLFEHNFNIIIIEHDYFRFPYWLFESMIRSNTVVLSLPFRVLLLPQHILSLNKDIQFGERDATDGFQKT